MRIQLKRTVFPDAKIVALNRRQWPYRQCFERTDAFLPARICGIRGDEGCDGSANALSGQGTGSARIAVNIVAPGAIETDFGGGAVRDNAQINAFIASQTALGRVGLPDDIGGMVASLLSDDNRWLTV